MSSCNCAPSSSNVSPSDRLSEGGYPNPCSSRSLVRASTSRARPELKHVQSFSVMVVAGRACPVQACRSWVDAVVIGLSLCPWAKPVRDSGGLRYSLTQAREADTLSAALLHEIELLRADPEIETTILVHPHVFADDFLAFTEYTQNTEAWMQDEGLDKDLLLVGFHPAHQFMYEEKEDAGNVCRHAATLHHPRPHFCVLPLPSLPIGRLTR